MAGDSNDIASLKLSVDSDEVQTGTDKLYEFSDAAREAAKADRERREASSQAASADKTAAEETKGKAAAQGSFIDKLRDGASAVSENNALMAAAAAAGGAFGAIVGELILKLPALFAQFVSYGDQIKAMADKTQMSTTELQRWMYTADMAGVSSGSLINAVTMLNQRLGDTDGPGKRARETLASLGVTQEQLASTGGNVNATLMLVAGAMSAIESPTARANAAYDIFGRQAKELLPLLVAGSEELEKAAYRFEALGIAMSDKAVQASDLFTDSVKTLALGVRGVLFDALEAVIVPLSGFVDWIVDAAAQSRIFIGTGELLKASFEILMLPIQSVMTALISLGVVIQQTGTGIATFFATITTLAERGWSAAKVVWDQGMQDIKAIGERGMKGWEAVWNKQKDGPKNAAEGGVDPLNAALESLVTTYKDKLAPATAKQQKDIDSLRKLYLDVATGANKTFKGSLTDIADALKAAEGSTKGAKDATGNLKEENKLAAGAAKDYEEWLRKMNDALEDCAEIIEKDLIKQQAEANRLAQDWAREAEAQDAAARKLVGSLGDEADKLQEGNDKLRDQITQIGLTTEQIGEMEAARWDNQAAMLAEEAASKLLASPGGAYVSEYEAIMLVVSAMSDRAKLIRSKATAEAEAAAIKESTDAWVKMGSDISASLTDSLVRGFESGKGFLDSLIDYIKNGFKSLVVKLLVQPVMSSIAGGVLGMLGAPASAVESIGGGSNLFSGGTGVLGGVGSFFSGTGNFLSGLTSLQTPAAAFNQFLMGGSGTQLLGAAAPYALAAYALYRIISGKGTGRDRSPSVGYQGIADVSTLGGTLLQGLNPNYHNERGGTNLSADAQDFVKNAGEAILAAAKSFGGTVPGIAIGAKYSVSEDMSEWGAVSLWGPRKNLGIEQPNLPNEEAVQKWIAASLPRLMLAGLQNADLSKPFQDYFAQFDAATVENADSIIAVATEARTMEVAFQGVHGVFAQLSSISVEARQSILGLTGGLESFIQKAQGYIAAFYTENEQAGIMGKQMADALRGAGIDITGLDTKAEYRAIMEKLDLSTAQGQTAFAVMLNNAQGFASLSEYMKQNNVSLDELAAIAKSDPMLTIIAEKQTQATAAAETSATQQTTIADNTTATKEAVVASAESLNEVKALLTKLIAAAESGHSMTTGAVKEAGSAVYSAVNSLANRPINVTVEVPEVNGGKA